MAAIQVSMCLDSVAQGVAQGSDVAYGVNAATGDLTLLAQESSRGIAPRQFSLSHSVSLCRHGVEQCGATRTFRSSPS